MDILLYQLIVKTVSQNRGVCPILQEMRQIQKKALNFKLYLDKNTILQYKLLYRKLKRKAYGEQRL